MPARQKIERLRGCECRLVRRSRTLCSSNGRPLVRLTMSCALADAAAFSFQPISMVPCSARLNLFRPLLESSWKFLVWNSDVLEQKEGLVRTWTSPRRPHLGGAAGQTRGPPHQAVVEYISNKRTFGQSGSTFGKCELHLGRFWCVHAKP